MEKFFSLDEEEHPPGYRARLVPAFLQPLLTNNPQVATFQALGKLGCCWPCGERTVFAQQHRVGKEKMFFLLKLTLECCQTRRELHRTSNRMRDAFSQWAKHAGSIFMHWRETGYYTEDSELTHSPAGKRLPGHLNVLPHRYLYSFLAPSLLLPP